jgi:hypothetical protein
MLRWLNTVVVSDEEKARTTGQAGIGKASASEPLVKCRDQLNGIETGHPSSSGKEPGGYPFTGQAVPGMKVARARSAAFAWNAGTRVPVLRPAGAGSERERAKQQKLRGAEYRYGLRRRTGS